MFFLLRFSANFSLVETGFLINKLSVICLIDVAENKKRSSVEQQKITVKKCLTYIETIAKSI